MNWMTVDDCHATADDEQHSLATQPPTSSDQKCIHRIFPYSLIRTLKGEAWCLFIIHVNIIASFCFLGHKTIHKEI